MDTPNKPSIYDRSPVARGVGWFVSWRSLIILAWAATLVALFYGVENWRGGRAWNKYRQELEAGGAALDYRALWPKAVPDDQNFASIPLIREWFEHPIGEDSKDRWQDAYSVACRMVLSSRSRSNERARRQFMDLVAWEDAFKAIRSASLVRTQEFQSGKLDLGARAKAAPGVLEGLKTDEAVFAELRAASSRPFARYPFHYEVGLPGGIGEPGDFWQICPRLELQACAELAAGQGEKALADVKLLFYLVDSFKAVPLFHSQWSRVYRFRTIAQPIWEGLAEHAWSPAELRELVTLLRKIDFLADCQFGLEAERASALWTIDCLPKSSQPGWLAAPMSQEVYSSMLVEMTHWPDLICRFMPRGWYDREKLIYCEHFQMYLRSGFDPATKRVSPEQLQANAAEADRLYPEGRRPDGLRAVFGHGFAAARLLQRRIDYLIRGFCYAQTLADQAALGCALEQFRLAHGQYPESLEALAPQFIAQLPKDALTGEAYKYRRDEDGQFVLYSVGWNEKDEGGRVVSRKDGSQDLSKGDWAWEYPQP
jgi:hypothetical protein